MNNSADYIFTEFTQDHGPLAQLQEWANHNHVELAWDDYTSQENGISSTTSYPIIEGYGYPDFTGIGPKIRIARGKAAEMIIQSPGTLIEARSRGLPTIIPSAVIATAAR